MRLGDFELCGGRVYLRKTGNSATLDMRLLAEILAWLAFHLYVRARAAARRALGRRGPSLWFTPDIPHPRYMIRTAAMWAGARIARSPAEADATFFFEDATRSIARAAPAGRSFNFGCTDISKSRVAAVFEDVFGYPLAVDPTRWTGEAVEKSEENGAHDGRIIGCPWEPKPGKTYQHLIDAIDEAGRAVDLRTHCVGGVATMIWVKKRSAEERFLPHNLAVEMREPRDIFSDRELDLISRFTGAMGADWCALDILRDRSSGRIYIVDVNKTDAGPITALSFSDKLASAAVLAKALVGMIGGGGRLPRA